MFVAGLVAAAIIIGGFLAIMPHGPNRDRQWRDYRRDQRR